MGGKRLNAPVVGMAPTPDGQRATGSSRPTAGSSASATPASTDPWGAESLAKTGRRDGSGPDGHGYWLVASDGGVFSFGDVLFHGSMGGRPLDRPIVAIETIPGAGGYWEIASDGGIFAFDAPYYGSMGGRRLVAPVVGGGVPDPRRRRRLLGGGVRWRGVRLRAGPVPRVGGGI